MCFPVERKFFKILLRCNIRGYEEWPKFLLPLVFALPQIMMCAQQNIIIKQAKENSNGLLHIDR